jgi:AcrR family transcriptional regulator
MAATPTTRPSPPRATNERLTRDVVLREAIALLDAEGYDALTMRRLAERLGVVPMALYRHVTNKDDLLAGLLDLAVTFVPIPPLDIGWRAGLGGLARSIRATMLAHPGVVTPLVAQPNLGPHSLLLAEYGLALMRTAGFSDEVAIRAPNAVIVYTIGYVALEVPRLEFAARVLEGTSQPLTIDYEALPSELFTHTLVLRPGPEEFINEAQFEFGLERILDGIAMTGP